MRKTSTLGLALLLSACVHGGPGEEPAATAGPNVRPYVQYRCAPH